MGIGRHGAPPPASDFGVGDPIDVGRRSDLDLRRDQALTVLDLCTSSLLHLYDLSPAIANAIQQDPIGEPYLALDMLLALCHHESTHDLSKSA